jgi:hypothetical protein
MEKIVITFEKHRQIIYKCALVDVSICSSTIFYEHLGLERLDKFKNDGVHFKVTNKSKLLYAMIKYGFTL